MLPGSAGPAGPVAPAARRAAARSAGLRPEAHGLDWIDDRATPTTASRAISSRHESCRPSRRAPVRRRACRMGDSAAGVRLARRAGGGRPSLRWPSQPVPARLQPGRQRCRAVVARLRNLMRHLLAGAGELLPTRTACAKRSVSSAATAATGLRLPVGGTAICVYQDDWWLAPAEPAAAAPTSLGGTGSRRWRGRADGVADGWKPGGGWRLRQSCSLPADLRRGRGERCACSPAVPRSLKNLLQEWRAAVAARRSAAAVGRRAAGVARQGRRGGEGSPIRRGGVVGCGRAGARRSEGGVARARNRSFSCRSNVKSIPAPAVARFDR